MYGETIDGNDRRMLQPILNKSWRQHPAKQRLYGNLPAITKTTLVRWTRHAGHYWRRRDELITDILLWTPSYGWAKAGWPTKTNILQLCVYIRCSLEYLPGAMDDRDGWRERVRWIRAGSATWWWFLWNTNSFQAFDPLIRYVQLVRLRVRRYLGEMTINKYFPLRPTGSNER